MAAGLSSDPGTGHLRWRALRVARSKPVDALTAADARGVEVVVRVAAPETRGAVDHVAEVSAEVARPVVMPSEQGVVERRLRRPEGGARVPHASGREVQTAHGRQAEPAAVAGPDDRAGAPPGDRKSTRLNSSHPSNS